MTSEPDAVVITASRYPHGYASIRSLAACGLHTIAAVDDEDYSITNSRYCDEAVLIPPPSNLPEYKNTLLDLAARQDIQTIIPHRPHDTYILSKFAEEFDRYIDVIVPPLETLEAVHDRKQLVNAAKRANVAFPDTKLLSSVNNWDTDRIIKSRYNLLTDEYLEEFAFEDSKIAKSVEHLPAGDRPNTSSLIEKMHHEPIVQEYVEGDEYLFGALYDHCEALGTFQHRQIRGDSYTGSGGVYRTSVDIPGLEKVGRAILNELEWHGLACIEYIKDAKTGEFTIVEINPRMWQSLACATRAGADFPAWYWHMVNDRTDLINPGYNTGIGTHYLYGELEHLLSIIHEDSPLVDRPSLPRRTGEILWSFCSNRNFDYLHIDDPQPIIHQVSNELKKAAIKRFR